MDKKAKPNINALFSANLGKVSIVSRLVDDEPTILSTVHGPRSTVHTASNNAKFLQRSGSLPAASWAVAVVGVAAYTFWTNRDNGQVFTKEDQSKWNAAKEEKK
eukprot:jgi/Psemu1/4607/gm1.4607_g